MGWAITCNSPVWDASSSLSIILWRGIVSATQSSGTRADLTLQICSSFHKPHSCWRIKTEDSPSGTYVLSRLWSLTCHIRVDAVLPMHGLHGSLRGSLYGYSLSFGLHVSWRSRLDLSFRLTNVGLMQKQIFAGEAPCALCQHRRLCAPVTVTLLPGGGETRAVPFLWLRSSPWAPKAVTFVHLLHWTQAACVREVSSFLDASSLFYFSL